jgi:hypothetical protein
MLRRRLGSGKTSCSERRRRPVMGHGARADERVAMRTPADVFAEQPARQCTRRLSQSQHGRRCHGGAERSHAHFVAEPCAAARGDQPPAASVRGGNGLGTQAANGASVRRPIRMRPAELSAASYRLTRVQPGRGGRVSDPQAGHHPRCSEASRSESILAAYARAAQASEDRLMPRILRTKRPSQAFTGAGRGAGPPRDMGARSSAGPRGSALLFRLVKRRAVVGRTARAGDELGDGN